MYIYIVYNNWNCTPKYASVETGSWQGELKLHAGDEATLPIGKVHSANHTFSRAEMKHRLLTGSFYHILPCVSHENSWTNCTIALSSCGLLIVIASCSQCSLSTTASFCWGTEGSRTGSGPQLQVTSSGDGPQPANETT